MNFYFRIPLQQRQGQQKAGHELAAHIAGQGKLSAFEPPAHLKGQGCILRVLKAQSLRPADGFIGRERPFAQIAPSGKAGVHPQGQGQWHQKPQGGAGFPAVHPGALNRGFSAGAPHLNAVSPPFHLRAQGTGTPQGGADIIRGLHRADLAEPPGQGRAQNRPMGQGFGGGRGHAAPEQAGIDGQPIHDSTPLKKSGKVG